MTRASSNIQRLNTSLAPVAGNNALQINAAIAALSAAGGGTVTLSAGQFPTTTSIVMLPGVDLVGQGMLATVIRVTGVDGIVIDFLEEYGNTRISNLAVEGVTGTTTRVGIHRAGTLNDADEMYGFTIDNCGVRNFNIGIRLLSTRNLSLFNNWVQDVNSGLHLVGAVYAANVYSNRFVLAAGCGAGVQYGILCDTFNYTAGTGSVRPEGIRLRDNTVYGFEQGITFEGVVYAFAIGCDVQATVAGITWSTASALLSICDNYIQVAGANASTGIHGKAQASVIDTSIRVERNHINAFAAPAGLCIGALIGTNLTGNQDNVILRGNSFVGFTLYDIAVYQSGHIKVVDNECYSTGVTGSILTSALPGISRPVVIEGNDCRDSIDFDTADLASGALRLGNNIVSGTTAEGNPWVTPAFNAADFTANGAMSWTLQAGDVTTYAYRIDGKMMTLLVTLATTTVGGTLNSQLLIKVPAGRTAAKRAVNPCLVLDNNVRTTGFMDVAAGGTVIAVSRTDAANFTASTNLTYVYGQITFEIQ